MSASKNRLYLDVLESVINDFLTSRERREALDGVRYYMGDHDILKRCRTAVGEGGGIVSLPKLPCARIVNNQYGRLIDQKVNYSLGRQLIISVEGEERGGKFTDELKKYFGAGSKAFWQRAARDAMNCGHAWIYTYIDEAGEFKLKRFNPTMCVPLWRDEEHTVLDALIRLCPSERYEGRRKIGFDRAFVYSPEGTEEYLFEGGRLKPAPHGGSDSGGFHFCDAMGRGFLWDETPVVPMTYGGGGVSLIRGAKALQDGLNELISEFADNMAEDARSTVLVLKNFDGQDLGEFRRNLASYGAVKVRSDGEGSGGVDTLSVDVNAENYESLRAILNEALTEACRGYDVSSDRMGSNPTNMNILAVFSDIDLDADGFESAMSETFDRIIGFLRSYLYYTGRGDYRFREAKIKCRRDLLVNEADVIDSLSDSAEMLSRRTAAELHPMIDDAGLELRRIKNEK